MSPAPQSPSLSDFLTAHRKAILALLSLVLVQVVDSQTADWAVVIVGSILTGVVRNDSYASARIYRRRR